MIPETQGSLRARPCPGEPQWELAKLGLDSNLRNCEAPSWG